MQQILENIGQEVVDTDYPDSTYLVVSKVGYLLGVPKRFLSRAS